MVTESLHTAEVVRNSGSLLSAYSKVTLTLHMCSNWTWMIQYTYSNLGIRVKDSKFKVIYKMCNYDMCKIEQHFVHVVFLDPKIFLFDSSQIPEIHLIPLYFFTVKIVCPRTLTIRVLSIMSCSPAAWEEIHQQDFWCWLLLFFFSASFTKAQISGSFNESSCHYTALGVSFTFQVKHFNTQ